ncbi:MAG: ABC transporter permease, partial [Isosphaeraceae bacterium]
MIPWPILRRELKAAAHRREVHPLRSILASVLGLAVAVLGGGSLQGDLFGRNVFSAEGLRDFGLATLILVELLQVMALAFLVPALVGGAIAEDRERDTLQFLLLTRLTRLEIVLAKLLGRLAPGFSLTLVAVPFVVFATYLTGLFPELAVLVIVVSLSTTLMMGAVSLNCSAWHSKAGNARASAMGTVWAWLIFTPVLAIIPLPSNPIGAALVWPLRTFGEWVGPSSPVSLLVNVRLWVTTSRWLPPLVDRLQVMLLTQSGLSLLAIGAAVLGMRRHEPRRSTVEPGSDGRPPCGDDPIYWREHDLAQLQAFQFRPAALLRGLVALVRLLTIVLFQLVVVALMVALPVTLIVVTARHAAPSFQERWLGGAGTEARDEFSRMIQLVSCFVAMLNLVSLTSTLVGKITIERDRGTWDALLTTPLEGR